MPGPARSSSADDAEQEQPTRRRQRFSPPTSLSKMLFDWPIWSQLSSTTTSKVNTETGGRSLRAMRNRTVMTVSHDEGTRGVHVQLRREFRFVSPPAPETPVFAHPRRSDQLIEPVELRDAPTARRGVDRIEKGKGKAVEIIASDHHTGTEDMKMSGGNPAVGIEEVKASEEVTDTTPPMSETMTTALSSLAERPDEREATEEMDDPAHLGSKILKSEAPESERRERTAEESQDQIEGASIAPTNRSQDKTPEEPVNDTQGIETEKSSASQPPSEGAAAEEVGIGHTSS